MSVFFIISLLTIARAYFFGLAIDSQVRMEIESPLLNLLSILCVVFGQLLIISSCSRIGVHRTFLGEYFGLPPLNSNLDCFPFTVCDEPVYWGSTLTFLGYGFFKQSPVGILLSAWTAVTYLISITFESYTMHEIYLKKNN